MNAAETPQTPTPSSDLVFLRSFMLELIEQGQTHEALDIILDLIEQLRDTNNRQAIRIAKLLKHRFGRRSEKLDASQLSLFLASVPDEDKSDEPEDHSPDPIRMEIERLKKIEKQQRKHKRKKRPGRNPISEDIERETHRLEVPESERRCERCGTEKVVIGTERSEVLEFVPAHFKVLVYEREKMACKSCGDGVVVAPVADKVVEGGRPGPGLLAHLVVSKYKDGLPINRLVGIYERSGVRLPASTLGQWVGVVADTLEPVYKVLTRHTLQAHVLGVDDTGLKVLDRKAPNNIKRGHLWAFVGYEQGLPTRAVFHYTPTWEGEGPLGFMTRRTGLVQGDGYAGLNPLFQGPDPPCTKVGCMAHARRYFKTALDAGDLRAAVAVEYFQKLYSVEELATLQNLDIQARQKLRHQHARPLMNRLGAWVAIVQPQAEPKSSLSTALTYLINQWDSLTVYLDDGAIPIDNNAVERHIRPIAVGRKNYLFAGSDQGAVRAAILYSLMACCVLAKVDPLAWLTDVLTKLAASWPARRLDELLPENWKPHPSSHH